MSDFTKTLIIAIVGSGAFCAIINNLFDMSKKKSSKEDAKDRAIMFLLASAIRTECQEHINTGEIHCEDLERLEKAWAIYHNELGGNGFLDTYMKEVRGLSKTRTGN